MEAALIRVTEILRRKESELDVAKRTVNAECAERVRLLALLRSLQPEADAATAAVPPNTASAAMQSLPPKTAESAPQRAPLTQPTNWTMQRQPAKRGGHRR